MDQIKKPPISLSPLPSDDALKQQMKLVMATMQILEINSMLLDEILEAAPSFSKLHEVSRQVLEEMGW